MRVTIHRGLRQPRVEPRSVVFTLLVLNSVVVFWRPLMTVFAAALSSEQYSHILLILPVSVALLYHERADVFRDVEYCLPAGLFLLVIGAAFVWMVQYPLLLSSNDTLSLRMAFFTIWLVVAFVFCFGIRASRAAAFPLMFVFLMVPIPDLVVERIVWLLQRGSTDATFLLMKATNIPVTRQGFVLSLPVLDIEVARECSSIRSSLLLLVVSLVTGHLFLRPGWRQVLLAVLVFPIAVAKNGLRIFAITTLAVYVNPSFMTGNLHRNGGILFFLLALAVVMMVIWWLHKSEPKGARAEMEITRGQVPSSPGETDTNDFTRNPASPYQNSEKAPR